MTEREFWDIIDSSRDAVRRDPSAPSVPPKERGDDFFDRQVEKLKQRLGRMTPEEILGFDEQFSRQLSRAHRWHLWGAVDLIDGGCSDDGFMNFCATLVSLGYELFTQVLNDPDSLSGVIDRPDVPGLQREELLSVADYVYEERTGRDLSDDRRQISDLGGVHTRDFDFDDASEMARRYPKLAARFLENLG